LKRHDCCISITAGCADSKIVRGQVRARTISGVVRTNNLCPKPCGKTFRKLDVIARRHTNCKCKRVNGGDTVWRILHPHAPTELLASGVILSVAGHAVTCSVRTFVRRLSRAASRTAHTSRCVPGPSCCTHEAPPRCCPSCRGRATQADPR
jgi:hypothetical protein